MRHFFICVMILFITISSLAQVNTTVGSNPEREFIMSCTYGVLAGTLVGAASLAFVDKPGDNLQRVARGASIGLYMGIILGYYTVFVLPKQLQKDEERLLDGTSTFQPKTPNWAVAPLVGEWGVEGVVGTWQVATF